MPRGAKEEGHKSAHRSAGHRLQREAGAIQVGGGANSVLGEPLPAAEGTLRAPRRHPPSVSRPWVCSDLLALCSAVMLGALSLHFLGQNQLGRSLVEPFTKQRRLQAPIKNRRERRYSNRTII